MKDVLCYEFFGGIALENHTFSFSFSIYLQTPIVAVQDNEFFNTVELNKD